MKNLFSIAILIAFVATSFAQSTSPRFGTGNNQDNTGRALTYKYVSVTDAAGADSVIAKPSAFQTIYRVTLTDSLTFKQPVVTTSYAGDNMIIICSAATGTPKLKFTGSNWLTAGSATLSTNLRSVIRLVFDGAKWVETGRYTQ